MMTKIKNINKIFIAISILFLILAIHPIFSSGIWTGSDWEVHAYRLSGVNYQISNHQFPLIFDFWSSNQQGYAWSLFYPPLTTYLMALTYPIYALGISDLVQIKLIFLLLILFSFASCFYSTIKLSLSLKASILCAGIYICSPYFLTNIYVRFALGEIAAMCFIPLFFLSLNYLILENKKFYITFITSSAGILLSNIPSCIPALLLALSFFLLNYKRINILIIKKLLIASIFMIMACSFYIFPLIYNFIYGDIYAFSGMSRNYEYMYNSAPGIYDAAINGFTGTSNKFYLSLGIAQLILTICALLKKVKMIRVCSALSLILFIMSTKLFPWNLINESMPIINIMQFPWRLLSTATILSSICTAYMLTTNSREVMITACVVIFITSVSVFSGSSLEKRSSLVRNSFYPDYLNNTAAAPENYDYVKKVSISNQPVKLIHFEEGYPVYEVNSKESTEITLPVIFYHGYKIKIGNIITLPQNNRGLISLAVPAGVSVLQLKYDYEYIIISYLISAVSILVMYLCHRRYLNLRDEG